MGTLTGLAMRCGIAEGAVKEALEALKRGDVTSARMVLEFARLVAMKDDDDARAARQGADNA